MSISILILAIGAFFLLMRRQQIRARYPRPPGSGVAGGVFAGLWLFAISVFLLLIISGGAFLR